MKLFYVKDTKTGKRHAMEGAGVSPYFNDKQVAKALRNELNGPNGTRFIVARGPDHWRGES